MNNKLQYTYPIWFTFRCFYTLLNGNELAFSTSVLALAKFHESLTRSFSIKTVVFGFYSYLKCTSMLHLYPEHKNIKTVPYLFKNTFNYEKLLLC